MSRLHSAFIDEFEKIATSKKTKKLQRQMMQEGKIPSERMFGGDTLTGKEGRRDFPTSEKRRWAMTYDPDYDDIVDTHNPQVDRVHQRGRKPESAMEAIGGRSSLDGVTPASRKVQNASMHERRARRFNATNRKAVKRYSALTDKRVAAEMAPLRDAAKAKREAAEAAKAKARADWAKKHPVRSRVMNSKRLSSFLKKILN